MKKLLLATRNGHKLTEIRAILAGVPVELVGLSVFPEVPEVEENGETLEENALLKARSAAEHTGLPSAADDTGLFVDALGGAPGVRSARYAGPECIYERNNAKLLAELEGLPPGKRSAHFECVVALVVPERLEMFFRGRLPGEITAAPRGENGFGYDPVFQPDDMENTLAELSAGAKNAVSHRCIAFRRLRDFLLQPGGLPEGPAKPVS